MICLAALGAYTTWRTYNGSTDFDTFYYAARRVVSGEPLYGNIKGLSPYIYPPFFACLLTPLTILNLGLASFLWYLLNLFLFAASIAMSAVLIFGHNNIKQIWKAVPFLPKAMFLILAGAIFIDNISLLQPNILLFSAVISGLYFFKKGRPAIGGMLLGLAISIKLLPALFIAYFTVKREIKMTASSLAWIVIFTLIVPSLFLGPRDTLYSLKTWNENVFSRFTSFGPNDAMLGGMFNPVNQSITASLSRWLTRDDAGILYWKTNCYKKYPAFALNFHGLLSRSCALAISRVIEYSLVFITLLSCLPCKKGYSYSPERPAHGLTKVSNREFSLIFLASLFLDPLLRTPHLVFMIFPSLFLVSRMRRGVGSRRVSSVVFTAAVILYLSLGVKVFRIFGFGTISLVILWLMVLVDKEDLPCPKPIH